MGPCPTYHPYKTIQLCFKFRWRPSVPHHEEGHGQEGLQGVGRGHQGQDSAFSLQRRKRKNGSHSSTQFTQKQGSVQVKAGQIV